MSREDRSQGHPSPVAAWTAAALVAATILAASSMGSYVVPGSAGPMRAQNWPQPIGWVVQVLVVETWPSLRGVEIRWLAWALGNLALLALTAIVVRRLPAAGGSSGASWGLAATSGLLVAWAGARAVFAQVPVVGYAWTVQTALALCWMLALYFWASRLPAEVIAKAIAVALAGLAAMSLLYAWQGRQPFPGWPTGNVLLLTTGCLVGLFVAGAWFYALLRGPGAGARPAVVPGGLIVLALFLLMAFALALASRRAGLLGLLAGGAFLLLLRFARAGRLRLGVVLLVALVGVLGAVAVPYLLHAGRYETVVLRAELYRRAIVLLLLEPATFWIGVGPGQVGFGLTTMVGALRAQSPRLFEGQIVEHVHNDSLEAIVSLGVPMGLLYVALGVVALVGYLVACRREEEPQRRSMMAGLGAALAAALAAESTSVGMRHPGVASLVWALIGIGWACGARAGLFEGVAARVGWPGPGSARPPATARRVAAVLVGIALVALSARMFATSRRMYDATRLWSAGRSLETIRALEAADFPPSAGSWMIREYTLGRVWLARAQAATLPAPAQAARARAVEHLQRVADASRGYMDSLVWLGRALGSTQAEVGLSTELLEIDPFDQTARLTLARHAQDPRGRLEHLRLALRNGLTYPDLAERIARTLYGPSQAELTAQRLAVAESVIRGSGVDAIRDPLALSRTGQLTGQFEQMRRQAEAARPAQELFAQWQVLARQALAIRNPAEWPDPLALETMRMAVALHAQGGRLAAAAEAADAATVLLERQQVNLFTRRADAVALEPHLDKAWYGWLGRPGDWRRILPELQRRVDDYVFGAAAAPSDRAAYQFLAMLHLQADQGREALRALVFSKGAAAGRPELRRLTGLAYARLVALLGPSADPRQVEAWSQEGQRLLGGAGPWQQALQEVARLPAAWWYGVLPAD